MSTWLRETAIPTLSLWVFCAIVACALVLQVSA